MQINFVHLTNTVEVLKQKLNVITLLLFHICFSHSFNALMLLVGQQEAHVKSNF